MPKKPRTLFGWFFNKLRPKMVETWDAIVFKRTITQCVEAAIERLERWKDAY